MKHKFISLLAACAAWLFVGTSPVSAQANPSKCVSLISKRLEVVGTADFDFNKACQIIEEFDFGKASEFVNDGGKRLAFQRIFTSMSEFIDLAPNDISGKAMKGYTKQSGLLINSSDLAKTEGNIAKLKEAFTQGGNFKSTDFDGVMSKLGDETKFDFDGASGTFTSKASGAKYSKHPTVYAQGEPDSVTHIMRGHTTNSFTDGLPLGEKSIFADSTKIFDWVDDALNLPISRRNPLGGNSFWVDFGPGKIVGKDINGIPTSKLRIVIRNNTTDVIHTTHPQ